MPALAVVLLILVSNSEARQRQRRTWFTQYRTLDVAENVGLWEVRSLYAAYSQGKDFELILTAKRKPDIL